MCSECFASLQEAPPPPPATAPGKQENKVQVCKVVFGTSRSCLLACRRCREPRSDPACDRLREAPAKNSAAAKNKSPNSNRHAVESDCGHFLRAAEVSQRAATSFHSVPLATDGWSSRGRGAAKDSRSGPLVRLGLHDGGTTNEIGQSKRNAL